MVVTNHAAKRLKQRLGLPKKAVLRIADKAYQEGWTHADARGRLKRYLDGLYLAEEKATDMRIHGNFIYLFHGNILITVLNLPKNLRGGVPR